jgi:uncharacterized membrane protein
MYILFNFLRDFQTFNMFKNSNLTLTILFVFLSIALFFYPNEFESRTDINSVRCKAIVLKVDNSDVQQQGLIKTGNQEVILKILDGRFKGKILHGNNPLLGQLDRDKLFKEGDKALVVLSLDKNGNIIYVNPQEIYRVDLQITLFVCFALAIVLFGGWTGARALLSFIFAALVIWKILIPYTLKGVNPIYISLGTVTLLTTTIIFLVAGLTRKGLAAFFGSLLGIITTCFLALYSTHKAQIHGAVMPFSEPLLYAGFGHLNLTGIYIGSIFLSASGAVMDLAMDIAASMDEIARKRPDLSSMQLAFSGITVGRSVVGTMVTTLLLAYCGGYITLLMFFMAQGVPLMNMFNLVYVAAEFIKTIAGSFGLILTAPFTAIIGAYILKL